MRPLALSRKNGQPCVAQCAVVFFDKTGKPSALRRDFQGIRRRVSQRVLRTDSSAGGPRIMQLGLKYVF